MCGFGCYMNIVKKIVMYICIFVEREGKVMSEREMSNFDYRHTSRCWSTTLFPRHQSTDSIVPSSSSGQKSLWAGRKRVRITGITRKVIKRERISKITIKFYQRKLWRRLHSLPPNTRQGRRYQSRAGSIRHAQRSLPRSSYEQNTQHPCKVKLARSDMS